MRNAHTHTHITSPRVQQEKIMDERAGGWVAVMRWAVGEMRGVIVICKNSIHCAFLG